MMLPEGVTERGSTMFCLQVEEAARRLAGKKEKKIEINKKCMKDIF